MSKLFPIIATLICFSPNAVYCWSIPLPLVETTTATEENPGIACSEEGDWLVQWTARQDVSPSEVYSLGCFYRRSSDNMNNWSDIVQLTSDAAIQPQFEFADDGSIVSFWSGWGTSPPTPSTMVYSRSPDKGISWSIPAHLEFPALTGNANNTNHHVATDGQGNWVVGWYSDGGNSPAHTNFSNSLDGGSTWNYPTVFSVSVEPVICTDKSGNWVSVWQEWMPALQTSQIRFVRSTNNGTNWTQSEMISELGESPNIATNSNGDWIVIWRRSCGIYYSRSTNNGVDWTAGSPLYIDTVGQPSSCPSRMQIHAFGQTGWLVTWGETYEGLMCSQSLDNGATWTPSVRIDEGSGADFNSNYSHDTAVGSDGHCAVVWIADPTTTTLPNSEQGDLYLSTAELPLRADLSITSQSIVTYPVFGSVMPTICVTNNGPEAATNVTVQVNLPDGSHFLSAQSSQGTWQNLISGIQFNLGYLKAGSSATFSVELSGNSAGSIMTGSASANQPDPDPSNGQIGVELPEGPTQAVMWQLYD